MIEKAQPYLLMTACGVIAMGGWVFAAFPERFNDLEETVVRNEEHIRMNEKHDAVQDQQIAALEEGLNVMGDNVSETNFTTRYLKDRWDKWEDYERNRKDSE